jgi:hypothetical protein
MLRAAQRVRLLAFARSPSRAQAAGSAREISRERTLVRAALTFAQPV